MARKRRFGPFGRIGVRTPKRSLKFSNVMAYRDSKPSFRCVALSAESWLAIITWYTVVSCVDGPRPARGHVAYGKGVACSHVFGLLVQSGRTAGPDGFRASRPHHSNGIAVPMKRQVALDCVGSTDCTITLSCPLASSVRRRFMPLRTDAGSSPRGASPPRRRAPSCWPRPPPRPSLVGDGAAR